jgi:FkbM family methyltransferase
MSPQVTMSRIDRAVGLLRSLAIYHAIPLRQRRLKALYREFVRAGDLVFDIGAHAGNHVRAFSALGCRVVALEPQPDFARLLRLLFSRRSNVRVVEAGVGRTAGRATLTVSERTPTVTSLADRWRDRRAADPDFRGVRWNRRVDVDVTTLDALIHEHGVPAFIKIDVEGSEPDALAGLSTPVPALAFEFLPRALEQAEACVARLGSLGGYVFNWSRGESRRLEARSWLSDREVLAALRSPAAQLTSGDVYARVAGPPRQSI